MAVESQVEGEVSEPSARSTRPTARRSSSAVSRLSDPKAYAATKRRLLELLGILARHGPVSLEEVAQALGQPSGPAAEDDPAVLRPRLEELEAEARFGWALGDLYELEADVMERAFGQERELLKESLTRIAHLEAQLTNARRTIVRLVAASRDSLAKLNRIRGTPLQPSYAYEALDPLMKDLREMAETVLELHALAQVRDASLPNGHGPAAP